MLSVGVPTFETMSHTSVMVAWAYKWNGMALF